MSLVWLCAPSQAQEGARGLTLAESEAVFEQNENYAVVVGIDKYEKLPALRHAAADARRLGELFRAQGYTVFELLDYEANERRILDAVERAGLLATNEGRAEQGSVVFAFAGHGAREGRENYLATGESDPDAIGSTGLALSAVKAVLERSGVRQRVLLIDACRNVPGARMASGPAGRGFGADAEGVAVFYSTGSERLSYEDPALGHGVFTHYVAEGLGGAAAGADGLVTFERLKRYVQRRVKRHVTERFGAVQVPYIGGEWTGEFVLARVEGVEEERGGGAERQLVARLEEERLELTREERRAVQRALNGRGMAVGVEDGVWGERTRGGIREWQLEEGLEETGYLDGAGYKELVVELAMERDRGSVPLAVRRDFEPELVRIRGGSFLMGSEEGEDDERPVREVRVEPFELGKYELTVGEYRRFVEASGHEVGGSCWYWDGEWKEREGSNWENPGYEQGEDHPVACVSWEDAQAYVEWLNEETGGGYRLPSESEWEYAARAGSETRYSFGDDEERLCEYGNVADRTVKERYEVLMVAACDDGVTHTAAVGSYKANDWGAHDMHGNVLEWVSDCWHESYAGAPADGRSWEEEDGGNCVRRVLRGGSWYYLPAFLRSADRYGNVATIRNDYSGFRVARTLVP